MMRRWNWLNQFSLLIAIAALLLCGRTYAAVDADADNAQPGQLQPAGTVSASSLDAVADMAGKLGVQLPPFLTAPGIEQQFQFIGPNGLSSDRPIGVIFFAGAGYHLDQGQGVIFALPVKPGAATVESFTKSGGQPLAGHPDTVQLNGAVFKREADYLLFGTTPEAVAAAQGSSIADLFKAPQASGALLQLKVDLKAIRQSNPKGFEQFLDSMKNGSPAKNANEAFGQQIVIDFVRNLNRLDLSLIPSADNVELQASLAPFPVGTAANRPRPGLPAGVAVRLDLDTSALSLPPTVQKLISRIAENEQHMTADQQRQLKTLTQSATELLAGGKTLSLGLEAHGGKFVLYTVQQEWSGDSAALAKQVAADFARTNELMQGNPNDETKMQVDHYAAQDQQVTRLTVQQAGQPHAYVDLIQKDQTLYTTIGSEDGHYVESLAALPARGNFAGLLSGYVDLGRTFDMIRQIPSNPVSELPADQRKALADTFKDKKIAFGAVGKGDELVIGIAVPQALLKHAAQMIHGGAANGEQ